MVSGGDAERVGGGGGGQEVHQEVRAGQGQRDVVACLPATRMSKRMPWTVPRQFSAETSQARSRPNQTRAALALLADARARAGRPVEDGDAVGAEPLQDLRLGVRDRVHGVEELEVDGRDHGDDGDVGPAMPRELAQLARGGHARARAPRSGARGREAQQRQGQAVLVVEVALRLEHRALRARAARAVISLVVVLPAEPVTADDRDARPAGARGGRGPSGPAWCPATRTSGSRAGAASVAVRPSPPTRPRACAAATKSWPSKSRPRDGHEELARRERARVDGDAGHGSAAARRPPRGAPPVARRPRRPG